MIRKAMWVGLLAGLVVMVGIVMFTFAPVRAQSADVETLARANQLYENGRFAEAAQTYEQVAAQGVTDAALFYNLGNAYYKLGDSGRAILNYERAALLAPRDADVYANLAMARAQVVDKYETNGGSALLRLAALGQAWLTLNETAVITLLLWLLPAGLFVLWRHSRGRLQRGCAA